MGRKKRKKTNKNDLKTLSFNNKDKIKGKVNSTRVDFLVEQYLELFVKVPKKERKTNEKGLKTLSLNDKDKIKSKVNSTRIDFLVSKCGCVLKG
ncbi:hypothetical protein DVH24_015599 [Malus domestica]|uniref:Uncharacterized protein n=1 Tax=Malus domestica TaxID=3750 RepID=A0A498HNI9_MALDO|nr:hypothetical protein DVH24_015599 [Malus domestica]